MRAFVSGVYCLYIICIVKIGFFVNYALNWFGIYKSLLTDKDIVKNKDKDKIIDLKSLN